MHHCFDFPWQLTFTFAVSGMIFCIIRTPPFYAMGNKGKPTIFSRSSQSQFVLEGLAVGGNHLLFALVIIAIMALTNGRMSKFGSIRLVLVTLLIGVAGMLISSMFETYTLKAGWYDPSATFPGAVVKKYNDFNAGIGKYVWKALKYISTNVFPSK